MADPSAGQMHAELAELAHVAHAVARECPKEIALYTKMACRTLHSGGKLMFCGNGGSAADAQHIAAEYAVRLVHTRSPLAALALTTDSSVLTACGNDFGFDRIFARQVDALGRPGDLLVLHSTSGNSANLIEAAQRARSERIGTVALLARDGGRLRDRVDAAIVVPTESVARAQELHLALSHIVCRAVEERLLGTPNPEESE